MNKKGFTLVELLAVIVLLSILVILVIPSITGSLKKQQNKTDALMLDMIEKAAKLYIDNNSSFFKENSYGYYCLTLGELVDNDYLKEGIEIDGEDITNTKSLKIFYDSNEMLLVDECVIPLEEDF